MATALEQVLEQTREPAVFQIIQYPHYANLADLRFSDAGVEVECAGCEEIFIVEQAQ